ncbi:MAG: flagellar biosynthesis protein FlhB [Clostridia bacterium]|nr:flagellar biosynthesis protein FlhB [Clostridia bacterium]
MPQDNGTGEKTEEATPKRKEDARKEGQVLKSQEVVTVGCLLIMLAALRSFVPTLAESLANATLPYWTGQYLTGSYLTLDNIGRLLSNAIIGFLLFMLPILAVALAAAIISNMAQTGFLFTSKALQPKFNRLNPAEGFKRMFSSRALMGLLTSILKTVLVGLVIYLQISADLPAFHMMLTTDVRNSVQQIAEMVFDAAFMISAFLAGVAFLDYIFQRRKFRKDLMMSKYEVKMEMKQQEGDPQIKGKIKQKQREMATMRMMSEVPDADVVITNPTHYAVALRYEEDITPAPLVIAKGQDNVALKIKEIAAEHDIDMFENKPLARSLYFGCEIGDYIPVELYQAVAEILAEVYKRHHGG